MRSPISLSILLSGICLSAISLPVLSQVRSQVHGSAPFVLVANKGDQDIGILDPSSRKQIAVVPEGGITGHEVAASPDGRTAYAPIYGNSGVGKPGTDGHFMDIIDIPTRKVIGHVDFGHGVRPHCPIYDPVSGLLYVTTELDKTVTVIDPHSLKIVGAIPTGQKESHMLALSRDGRRGYTANVGPGTVSVLDMKARKLIAVIPVAAGVQRISVSNNGRMVFTSDTTKPRLAVIDTATNKVKTWVSLLSEGYGAAPTKDGRWLLVTMPEINKVAVVDLASLKVVRNIEVPSGPSEILMRPDGKTAFVSCGGSRQVAVIDLPQWKVASLIAAGKGADGLAWAP